MTTPNNPFIDLYVTESISADTFVKVFSAALLDEADTQALYQPGNVLLIGLQGSGKTALLNLLKPEVLIAYRRAGVQWPLPDRCSRFVSAGINLSKSGALDFGQRPIETKGSTDDRRYAAHFADFLNYWLVDDLLQSVKTLHETRVSNVREFLGIDASEEKLEAFTKILIQKKCWIGALTSVDSFSSLRQALEDRVVEYRNFLNYNSDDLTESIKRTKTSAGEPISVTVDVLRECGVIPPDLPVLIRIDQFEDLMGLEEGPDQALRIDYRAVIYKMLGSRDSRLSYRVGARPYAVRQSFRMLGTASTLEELRNFSIVDIDSILRRKEHSRGVFPKFAEDVFNKRLASSGYTPPKAAKSTISYVFGRRPSAEDRARNYVKDATDRVVSADSDWPTGSAEFLTTLARHSPVSAKLGEAWLRQKLRLSDGSQIDISALEWESESRRWWKKERIEHALLQIAAARGQRMIWYGDNDILTLSGGNILVFLSICQLIWAEFLRAGIAAADTLPTIHSPIVQDLGIQQASEYWFRKLRADPNGGDDRQRFISILAGDLRSSMREDKRMSYPGANGFSLSDRDLDKHPDLALFLDLCSAYGVLTVGRHTPKTKGRGDSKKWYLFPILSPYFQLPAPHTKEPLYADVGQVMGWMKKANVTLRKVSSEPITEEESTNQEQMSLFPTKQGESK